MVCMVAIETNMLKNRLVKHHGVVFPTPNSPNRHDDHSAISGGQAAESPEKSQLPRHVLPAPWSDSGLWSGTASWPATGGGVDAVGYGEKTTANGNLAGEYEVVTIWKPVDEMSWMWFSQNPPTHPSLLFQACPPCLSWWTIRSFLSLARQATQIASFSDRHGWWIGNLLLTLAENLWNGWSEFDSLTAHKMGWWIPKMHKQYQNTFFLGHILGCIDCSLSVWLSVNVFPESYPLIN